MAEVFEDAMSRAVRIMALVRKEIRELMNDKMALLILFIIPITAIGVLGTSKPRTDLTNATVWIIDYDQSVKSEEFIHTFQTTIEQMTVYHSGGSPAPIQPALGQTESWGDVTEALAEETLPTEYLSAYIILPEGFQAGLSENGTTPIRIYYDMIDITDYLFVDLFILLGTSNVQLENMMFESDIIIFPETRPVDIMGDINILELTAPLMVSLILFFSMQLITTQCIVGDVPLKRLLNTNLRRGEVITGKIIAYTIISVFQLIATLILLQFFGINILSLWIDLFLVLLLNSIAGICMGVFISTIAKTRLQGSQLFLLFLFYFLIVQMYARYDVLLITNPLEQATQAYGKLALRGLSLGDVFPQIVSLTLIAAFFYFITLFYIKRIKKEFV